MKQPILKTAALLLAISTSILATAKEHTPAKSSTHPPSGFEQHHNQAITFTENKGQVGDQNNKPRPDVLFSGTANGLAYHIRNNGISYQLNRVDSWKDADDNMFPKTHQTKQNAKRKQLPDQITMYQVDIAWINQNQNVTIEKGTPIAGYNNYYLPVCPTGVSHVKTYTDVTLKNIYNNIDLHYYEKGGTLEYDYLVAPHADYHQIQLKVGGTTGISIQNDGSVVLSTPLGNIIEKAPQVYQEGKTVKAKWVLTNNTLTFDIKNYNPSLPLVIDPTVHITRSWGTYYGGTYYWEETVDGTTYGHAGSSTLGASCATDADNNVYMAGFVHQTASIMLDTIASVGSHQATFGGGSSVYMGSVAFTYGPYDAFLVKFNTTGVRQWATYYGGAGNDWGWSCAADQTGNIFMAGTTFSCLVGNTATSDSTTTYTSVYSDSTSIATPGSHQPNFGGSASIGSSTVSNAFLAKFDADGTRQWGTYYGGFGKGTFSTMFNASSNTVGSSCATDADGNVYLAGTTGNIGGDTIATPGSHQPICGSNSITGTYPGSEFSASLTSDAFLVKFNSAGVRQWGTYYGGGNPETGSSCATDKEGNVYLAGNAFLLSSDMGTDTSLNAVATPGSHQPDISSTGDDFLVKFNSAGVRQWGTYYGGTAVGGLYRSITTDGASNIYMVGAAGAPLDEGDSLAVATPGCYQSTPGSVYLVKFNPSGVRQWGTYYGRDQEEPHACATDTSGNVYITGRTYSADTSEKIATSGSWQPTYGGRDTLGYGFLDTEDGFLVKFNSVGMRQWGTYYGSTGDDEAFGCATDKLGHIYISGYSDTRTSEAIASSGSWQPTCSGISDNAILVQFEECISSLGVPIISRVGDSLISSAAGSYEWYKDGVLISGATTQSYQPTDTTGSYTVCCRAHGETCQVCSDPYSFTTGINEHTLTNAINIYPNPNTGQFEIALQLNTQDSYTLELTNALGQVLYHEELKNYIGTYHKQLDETKYGAGIYLFRVKSSKEQSVKKVISF